MLVTDLALRDMERETINLFGWIPAIMRRLWCHPATSRPPVAPIRRRPISPVDSNVSGPPAPVPMRFPDSSPEMTTVPADSVDARFRWRRHPQLRDRPVASQDRSNGVAQRDARSSAARGVRLARSERLDEARVALAKAASDETIDLTAIPGFWDLSRRAMLIACAAYDDVERFRDAAALAAHIRTTYRPRAVAPLSTTWSRRKVVAGGK